MTKEQLAALLNGRQYRSEITDEEAAAAKAAGLLVIFGASDDLVEFRGFISDEIGAYNGTTFRLCPEGLLPEWPNTSDEGWDESEAEDYFRRKALGFVDIEALWDEGGYSWVISPPSTLPHATFVIKEEGEPDFCRGIVIDMADLKA